MSYDINILGIKTSGKHGIYEIEKSSDQKFLVDVKITIDTFQGLSLIHISEPTRPC